MSNHYIRINENNEIIKAFSDDFESSIEGDICINENGERHYNLELVTIYGYKYKWENNQIVERPMSDFLVPYKAAKIKQLSDLSYEKRRAFCEDYVEQRALVGYYDHPGCPAPKVIGGITVTKEVAFATTDAFRTEFYRVEALIVAAETIAAVDAAYATANFPTSVVSPS